jgi:hypothetical protein
MNSACVAVWVKYSKVLNNVQVFFTSFYRKTIKKSESQQRRGFAGRGFFATSAKNRSFFVLRNSVSYGEINLFSVYTCFIPVLYLIYTYAKTDENPSRKPFRARFSHCCRYAHACNARTGCN